MPSFSALLGVSLTNPVTVYPLMGMIPPVLGTPRAYKPAFLHKPTKGATDQRWLVIWWQYSPAQGKVIRRRQGFDLASLSSKGDRERRAGEWVTAINTLLKEGYLHGEEQPVAAPKEVRKDLALPEVVSRFLAHKLPQVVPKVGRSYSHILQGIWMGWATQQGLTSLSHLQPSHGSSLVAYLAAYTGLRNGQPLSPRSYNKVASILGVFGDWAQQEGYLKRKHRSLFTLPLKPEGQSTLHRPYSQGQLKALLDLAQGDAQLTLFFHLLYYTFLRPRGEATHLQVQDFRGSTLWVRPEWDKNRVGRFVQVPPPLQTLLREHIGEAPPHYFLFTRKKTPGPKPVEESYFYQRLAKLLTQLGWDGQGHTLYSFKATGNIHLFQASGHNLRLVQRQNGHSSGAMSEKYLRQLGVIFPEDNLDVFPVMGVGPF